MQSLFAKKKVSLLQRVLFTEKICFPPTLSSQQPSPNWPFLFWHANTFWIGSWYFISNEKKKKSIVIINTLNVAMSAFHIRHSKQTSDKWKLEGQSCFFLKVHVWYCAARLLWRVIRPPNPTVCHPHLCVHTRAHRSEQMFTQLSRSQQAQMMSRQSDLSWHNVQQEECVHLHWLWFPAVCNP